MRVKAKRLPFFKVGKELRERVNASTAVLEHDDHDDEVVNDDDVGGGDDHDDAVDGATD